MVVRSDIKAFQNPLSALGVPDKEAESLMKRHNDFTGRIALVEVKGVPRIERQRALFIWDASPGSLRRNFLDRYYFIQQPNVIYVAPGGLITADYLFPKDDPIHEFVRAYNSARP